MDECAQSARVGHAAHQDKKFTIDGTRVKEFGDSEIDVRRKPAVQLDLPFTTPRPILESSKVEEVEVNGFLTFVGPISDQEHDAAVCFADSSIRRIGRGQWSTNTSEPTKGM